MAAILEHALQMARNEIEQATGYDFMNDFSGTGHEIYTYGNYLGSDYDYGDEAVQELQAKIEGHHGELINSIWCRYVFEEIGITLTAVQE